ncbi:MAG: SulP family inorganic anion transporter [Bryobacteraceae bacterium]
MRNAQFDKSLIARELLASVVVFLVALPLCMGIAIASGVPPALGLITGVIGGIVVGFLAGSPLQVSGPAAGLAIIVWELVRDHGLAALGVILVLAGFIQLLAGVLKIGQWFRAISPSVIFGMLAGIGILIFGAQFHVMVDDKPRASGIENLISIPSAIYKGIFPLAGDSHHFAAMVGIVTILTLILWTRFRPAGLKLVPAPLVAVVVATTLAAVLRLPIQYVDIPENLLESVNLLALADFSRLSQAPLILAAVAVAFIASAETLLSASAVDRMHSGVRTNYDRELAAQGLGNMLCGLVGALPMTGVIVRSSVNVQAGAKTRLSAIFHGIWLLAFVATMPGVLRMIPTAALAAILVHTGYKLVNPQNIRAIAQYGRFPVVIYAATVAGIVIMDLLTGVLIGIALSIVKLVYKISHLSIRLERQPGSNRADLYLEGAATFIRLPKLAAILDQLPEGVELHVHFDNLTYIDHACLDLFANWQKQREGSGGSLVVKWDGLIERYKRIAA